MSVRLWVCITLVLLAAVSAACVAAPAQEPLLLELTYPNGQSPRVFTAGWTFGARAVLNPGTPSQRDLSGQVRWSGSGSFSPAAGAISRPSFTAEGANTIRLTVTVAGKPHTKSFTVQAVKPHHVTVGARAVCPADAHGCPACPHHCAGPIQTGNPKVTIGGKPVACVGDTGTHAACCGPNTFRIVSGDPEVTVDGRPVARIGDRTQHCGGMGTITEAGLEPASGRGFAGTWKSNWGTLTVKVDGNKATGNYPHDQGRIEGTVSEDGRTLTGKWLEAPSYSFPRDGGKVVLTLAADGRSFSGRWGYGDNTSGGDWTGTRID